METVESRITAMLPRTASHIHGMFSVSSEQARQEARQLLELIESKGGECTNWSVVSHLLESDLGKRLEWRNSQDKLTTQKDREDMVAFFKSHFSSGR